MPISHFFAEGIGPFKKVHLDLRGPDGHPSMGPHIHPGSGELGPRSGLDPAVRRRVEETIDLCDLQRSGLCTKRIETMEFTLHWLKRMSKHKGPLDEPLLKEWRRLSSPYSEHKFVIRHILETRGQPRLAEYDRDSFA